MTNDRKPTFTATLWNDKRYHLMAKPEYWDEIIFTKDVPVPINQAVKEHLEATASRVANVRGPRGRETSRAECQFVFEAIAD